MWMTLALLSIKGRYGNRKSFKQGILNVCEWFLDNKLSIYFGEEKTKCIFFSKEKTCRSLT